MATDTRGWWGAARRPWTCPIPHARVASDALAIRQFTGYPVNRLCAGDLNGDGKTEVFVASGSGYLYALDIGGQVLWQKRAGRCVNDALVFAGPEGMRVAYADESGPVRIARWSAGQINVREMSPPSPARLLKRLLPSDQGPLLVMALRRQPLPSRPTGFGAKIGVKCAPHSTMIWPAAAAEKWSLVLPR